MTLGIAKTAPIKSGASVDFLTYNRDVQVLFDAFNGLEQQTFTLGALTITPSVNTTSIFKVTKSDGTVLFSIDATNHMVGIGMNVADYI